MLIFYFFFSNTTAQTYDAGYAIPKCAIVETAFFVVFVKNRRNVRRFINATTKIYKGVLETGICLLYVCNRRLKDCADFADYELLLRWISFEGSGGVYIKMLIDCVDGAPKHG